MGGAGVETASSKRRGWIGLGGGESIVALAVVVGVELGVWKSRCSGVTAWVSSFSLVVSLNSWSISSSTVRWINWFCDRIKPGSVARVVFGRRLDVRVGVHQDDP